jgi:4-amino-4-deoxy-L-arabinose transferase-like glycosyltransferase
MTNKRHIFVTLLLPVIFIMGMLIFFPFRFRFEFDFDEGINLIKALMTLDGFHLYSEVWSDQPPVFNTILALWFSIVGVSVNAGRVLVLGFSALLLAAVVDYLHKFWGIWHAIFGVFLMITLPFYTTLSVSVMIGLPSIVLAMMAFISMVRWHEGHKTVWLALAGSFLGLSVMTKLWTVILVPLFLIGIFVQEWDFRTPRVFPREGLKKGLIWSTAFLLVVGSVLLFQVRPAQVAQLVDIHLAAGKSEAMQSFAVRNTINSYLRDSVPLFILALIGAGTAARRKVWNVFYLILWTVAGYLLLHWIVPNWHHHQLLVTIPAAIIASIAIGECATSLVSPIRRSSLGPLGLVQLAGVVILFAFLAYQRLPVTLKGFRLDFPNFDTYEVSDQPDYEIVALIRNFANKTHYLFTDRPMYAFRSQVPVYPGLAVITEKRYATGEPSQEEITSILEVTKPEQIILSRFNLPAVNEYMRTRNYVRIDNSPRSRHYVMQKIYQDP